MKTTSNDRAAAGPILGTLMTGLLLVGGAGCARTSVEGGNVRAAGTPRPQQIVVHDFSVSPDAVTADSAIGSRIADMMKSTPEAQQHMKIGQDVAKATPVAGPSLAIEGQFLTIDEGNRLRRAVVGFGAGASEVRTLVQVFEATNTGHRLVEDFYTTVKSSRKPGLGPMAGVGAAAGRAATSAVVSSGVGVATAHSQTVEGDAKNTADEITKTLKKLFVDQGWIAP